jgi:glycerol-1-phosphate dehydrogenase [NAD(P)+]
MNIDLPAKIVIDRAIESKIDAVLSELKLGKKCLIICDSNVLDIGKKIRSSLKSFDAKMVAPTSMEMDYMKKLAEVITGFDFTIAIGGGRITDTCKYSSFLAKKPWVAFPTVLSHDGIMSSRAIIDSAGEKTSVEAKEPAAIFADIDVLKNSPYRYTAAGAGDCIANISAVEDWRLAEEAGKEDYQTLTAELALLSAKAVINHATEIKQRTDHGLEVLVWSLICSGFAMNIQGSSRPASGSEHNFSHSLNKIMMNSQVDAQKPKPLHGEQVAIGAMIMMHLHDSGSILSGSSVEYDWKVIKLAMQELGLPTTAEELGVSDEEMIRALVEAREVRDRYTILDEKNLDERDAEKILKKLGII